MLIFSVVVGVVLAAASVPASAVVMYSLLWTNVDTRASFVSRGIDMEIYRSIGFGSEFWFVSANGRINLSELEEASETELVEVDPRPAYASPSWNESPLDATYMHVRHGWPWLCAQGRQIRNPLGQGWTIVYTFYSKTAQGSVAIPYFPIWPGLLANTLFYATMTLALLAALRLNRTRRRRKRGRCIACGYKLGDGVTTCPECGLEAEPQV